ncbi:MAG TPA: HAMP domain-containing sensor histidine kinase [Galbitalea sp.]|nr:HAMP domain-containing sensor histidine kinase [Galbitalea sp.]
MTITVATLAVLVTGGVSLQLVRQSSIDEARARLAAQATLLAKLPAATPFSDLDSRVSLALGDTEAGVVSPTGLVTGTAAELLPKRLVRLGEVGRRVSTTLNGPQGLTLVEMRPRRGGGSLVLALPRDTVDAQAQGSLLRILLALGIGLVVAIIAGAIFARWLAKPLIGVAGMAARMARGERGVATPMTGPAEVVAVADALGALDGALASSEARQREFLLSISHELRTPLTALRGYAEAISDGMVGPADLPGVGQVLTAETERLDHFVADLLELARLEADDFSIKPVQVNLADILRSSRDAWLGRAAGLGVTLTVETQEVVLCSDPRRLRQIVDGLVENALRVSPDGSSIRLAGWADATGVSIEVRDGGPGLRPEDAAVAFERGVLRERYRDSRPVGTGLGLSIASRLTSRLGGSIRAGTAVAGGAVFTVTLPGVG